MIKRLGRDDQRPAVTIELIVPAARDGKVEIMPFEPRKGRARFIHFVLGTSNTKGRRLISCKAEAQSTELWGNAILGNSHDRAL